MTIPKYTRTANEKIWNVLQEIEEKKQLGKNDGTVRLTYYPTARGRNDDGLFETRKTVLEKLQSLEVINELHKSKAGEAYYWSFRLGRNYFKVFSEFDEREKEYQGFCNKDIPIKIIIADLTSKYHEIEKETNQTQFFIKIAHYGQYILKNRSTITILIPLYQEAKDDAKPYLKSWKDFVKLWKQYAKDILQKAVEADIKDNPNNPLENEISSIKNHLNDEDTSVWETDLQYYYIPYMTLIWKFNKLKKSNLLVPKHLDPENKIVISDIYSGARNEWDNFKVSREAKVWWAHYQVCRLAAGVLDLKIGTDYFKRDNIIDGFYKYEFGELAKGNPRDNPIVLHADRFAVWVKRLHEYLIPRLESLQNEEKVISQKPNEPSEKMATPSISNKYKISVKDREIWINEYLIGKPHGVGSNFEFFEYIRLQKPNIKINREALPNLGGSLSLKKQVKSKSFIKIVNELGFKGEILKVFFYNRGKDSLTYRGDQITKEDLEKTGVKKSIFLKELELAHARNSPE